MGSNGNQNSRHVDKFRSFARSDKCAEVTAENCREKVIKVKLSAYCTNPILKLPSRRDKTWP